MNVNKTMYVLLTTVHVTGPTLNAETQHDRHSTGTTWYQAWSVSI